MYLMVDAFWRAAAYCLRPRIMLLSLLPLALMVLLTVALGYFFWDNAIDSVRGYLQSPVLLNRGWTWLESVGLGSLKAAMAPLLVIFAVTPLIVILSLLLVGLFMAPFLADMVANRRFPGLVALQGASLVHSLAWSVGSTLLALLMLVVSLPLWLVPPLVLVVPALIWGWLTYRVMAFDALAHHASAQERHLIFSGHGLRLLCMGVFCGMLGNAPSLLWASGAVVAAAFVILVPLAIWIYTLVFVFSSLWFSHYCLAALQELRASRGSAVLDATPPAP